MNSYQVKVLITVSHTLDGQVEGDEDEDIEKAAFDEVDALLERIPVGLEYTMEIVDIQEVVDFP